MKIACAALGSLFLLFALAALLVALALACLPVCATVFFMIVGVRIWGEALKLDRQPESTSTWHPPSALAKSSAQSNLATTEKT